MFAVFLPFPAGIRCLLSPSFQSPSIPLQLARCHKLSIQEIIKTIVRRLYWIIESDELANVCIVRYIT